jgi:preprotein translocase subunit Sec63
MATILKKILIASLFIFSGWVSIGCTGPLLDYLDDEEEEEKEAVIRDCRALLGVNRNANRNTITGAHRALALRYHPDRATDEMSRERRTRVMAGLNKAKEILEAVFEKTEEGYGGNWRNEHAVLLDALKAKRELDA